jgi:hypothetical protein
MSKCIFCKGEILCEGAYGNNAANSPAHGSEMTGQRGELSFGFNITSFEELSQSLFDYLALSI